MLNFWRDNAGTWRDYVFEQPENQRKCILPINDITETIFYNQRFIISAPIPEPLCWRITKLEDISPKGVRRLTFAQDLYNEHTDYIERDETGSVIGMYADYWKEGIEPKVVENNNDPDSDFYEKPDVTSTITCSGKQQIRIGGSPKTFTVTYYDEEHNEILDHPVGDWIFKIDDEPVENELFDLTFDGSKVKIKFLGNDDYIGKILTVTNQSGDVSSSLKIEIIAL